MYKRPGRVYGEVEYTVRDIAEIMDYTKAAVRKILLDDKMRHFFCNGYYVKKKEFRRFMRINAKTGMTKYANITIA